MNAHLSSRNNALALGGNCFTINKANDNNNPGLVFPMIRPLLVLLGFAKSKPKAALPSLRSETKGVSGRGDLAGSASLVGDMSPPGVVADAAIAADPAPPLGGLGTVMIRNEFYRDGYRALQKIAIAQAVVILALIVAMLYVVHVHQPEDRFFATTEDGRLIPMVALNEPNLSTPALLSWVSQSATETMTFGFHDYRRRLQEASRSFTRTGWSSFIQALDRSGVIQTVESFRQIVTAAPLSAPILVSEGIVQGRYQWRVEVPLQVTYQSGSRTRADNLLVTLTIVRVPRLESPNGVGIEQWVAIAN